MKNFVRVRPIKNIGCLLTRRKQDQIDLTPVPESNISSGEAKRLPLLLLLSVALTILSGNTWIVPAQAADLAFKIDGATRTITTDAYAAMIDRDGAMPSLTVGGQEFFSSSAGVPRGLYLYQKGLLNLNQIEQEENNLLTAQNDRGKLRYEFSSQSITVTATNLTDEPMPFYGAIEPGVKVFINAVGQAVKTVASQNDQSSITWFRDKAKLKIEGGNNVFGPWGPDNLQIWQATLGPHETRQIVLTPGTATAEELAKLAQAGTNKPAPTDVAAPKLSADGSMNPYFKLRHEAILQQVKNGPTDLIFVGDSITNRWNNGDNKMLWDASFGKYHPINMGIEGDQTQHVLWRFDNGELDGISPKIAVVMIGTNNVGYSVEDIVKGDTKIVAELHRRLPQTKVLLLGIFPRGASANNPLRAKVKAVNAQLAKLDDGNTTRYLDFGDLFLEPDGSISKEMMPDAVHPEPRGYVIWADAIAPLLGEMMN